MIPDGSKTVLLNKTNSMLKVAITLKDRKCGHIKVTFLPLISKSLQCLFSPEQ